MIKVFFLSPSPPKNSTDNLRKVCTHRKYCPFIRSLSFSPKLARRKFKRNLSTSLCYRVKQESSSLSWRGTLEHSPTLAKIICYKKAGYFPLCWVSRGNRTHNRHTWQFFQKDTKKGSPKNCLLICF